MFQFMYIGIYKYLMIIKQNKFLFINYYWLLQLYFQIFINFSALTMTTSIDSCGQYFRLKMGESLFLKYDTGDSEIGKHGTNCTIKVFAPRNYNAICVQKADREMESLYKLRIFNNIFYIYLGSHDSNNKVCMRSE